MDRVEKNDDWARVLLEESSAIWVGYQPDTRDGAVTPNDDQGDGVVTRPADPLTLLSVSRGAQPVGSAYLDDLEARRAAVRAQRDAATA